MKLTLARVALVFSLLIPAYFMAAALGVKFGLWPWQFGLGVMIIKFGLPVLGIGLLLALIALVVCLVRAPRRGWGIALIALLIPAVGVGFLANVRAQSTAIPPIHDVATDIADPPLFSTQVMAARQAMDANPVNSMSAPLTTLKPYQGPQFAALGAATLGQVGHKAYPAVRPLIAAAPPAQVFTAAAEEAKAQGWTVVANDPASGVIEATAESFWFGFKDDVAIRVRPGPNGAGSVVDLRSTSRVGLSDLGANAKRIEAFLSGLAKRLAEG